MKTFWVGGGGGGNLIHCGVPTFCTLPHKLQPAIFCYSSFNLIGIFITISQTQILLHYYLSLVFITQVCTCVFYYCFPPFLHVKYMRDSYISDSCSWGTVLHETWFAHQASICYKEPTLQRQQHSQEAYLQCPKQCLNSMAAEVLTT